MAARLGDVLYWASCLLAASVGGLAAYVWATYRLPQDFGSCLSLIVAGY